MARDPWNNTVSKELTFLTKHTRCVSSGLLDQLYAHQIIGRQDFNDLTSIDAEEERARELLTKKLPPKGPEFFDKLCDQLASCGAHKDVLELLRGVDANANVLLNALAAEKGADATLEEGEDGRLVAPVPAVESIVRFGEWAGVQPKRVAFYVPPHCHSHFQAMEANVKAACATAGISKRNVTMMYESADEESGEAVVELEAPQNEARAVVCGDKVMLVSLLLYCMPSSELKIDDIVLSTTLSGHLNVSRDAIAIKETLDDSSVIISLNLEGLAGLFDVLNDAKKAFNLIDELKRQIHGLAYAEVKMGCLHLPLPLLPPVEALEDLAEAGLKTAPKEHLQLVLAGRFAGDSKARVVEAACIKLTENRDAQSWKDEYLFYAAGAGQVEICDVLLQQGADPKARVRIGDKDLSAIHVAAQGDHVDVIRSLLKLEQLVGDEATSGEAAGDEAGTEAAEEEGSRKEAVNSRDSEHNTPLHWASWYGNYNTVEILLQQQADPNAVNVYECAPLHYAAASGSAACIKLLTDAKANKEARVKTLDLTPLDVAIQEHQIDAVQSLLNAQASPVAYSRHYLQPLHLAASLGDHRCLKLLIEQGVGCRDESKFGTPMKLAERAGHLSEVIETVIEAIEGREIKKAGTVTELEDKLKNLSKDVELLNNRCTSLTTDSKELEKKVENLSKELDDQEKEAEENKKKASELEKKLTDEQDQLTKQVDEEKKKFEKLQADVTQFEEQHKELEKKIKELEQTALAMQKDIEVLEKTVGTEEEDPTETSDPPLASALDKPPGTEQDPVETTRHPLAAAAAASAEALGDDSP